MSVCCIGDCGRPVLARGWCGAHYRRWHKFGDPEYGAPLSPSGLGHCRIEGCREPVLRESLCPSHYGRLVRYGDPLEGRRRPGSVASPCQVDGCEKPVTARGLCEGHYKRLLNYGDPNAGGRTPLRDVSAEDRFWQYVEVGSFDQCWPWTAHRDRKGYGQFGLNGGSVPAHRFAYEVCNGAIPAGYHVHHTCDNKPCCNPRHLLPLLPGPHTLVSDSFSGRNSRKTHCKRGHELTAENCYEYPGKRVCKLCARERARESGARKRVSK